MNSPGVIKFHGKIMFNDDKKINTIIKFYDRIVNVAEPRSA